jgi:hypothetical protein
MENAPFHCGIVAKDKWLLDENGTGAVRRIFASITPLATASKSVQSVKVRVNAAHQAFECAKYTGFFTKLLKKQPERFLSSAKSCENLLHFY